MAETIKILLVEDSPSDVRLTEEALKEAKVQHELTVAHDGNQAIEVLNDLKQKGASHLPNVILLDLNMPKKNGHEVLAEIKDVPELKKIPVILLTVSQQDKDIMEALKLKMNYYLCKPVEAEKLSVLLNAIFQLHVESEEIAADKTLSAEDLHVRFVLAGNPHTSPMVLQKLSLEENSRVRARVAENPNTPPAVLLALSRDESAAVRISVSENSHAPRSVLENLARDQNDDVRLGLAENPNIPPDILSELASDENVFVADSAKKALAK
jgi:two-component system response regulator